MGTLMKAVLQLPAVVVVPVLAATEKVFCWSCGLYIIGGGGGGVVWFPD